MLDAAEDEEKDECDKEEDESLRGQAAMAPRCAARTGPKAQRELSAATAERKGGGIGSFYTREEVEDRVEDTEARDAVSV